MNFRGINCRFHGCKYPFTGPANGSPVNSICNDQISNWGREIFKYNSYLLNHGFLKTVEVVNSTALILSCTNILLENDNVRPPVILWKINKNFNLNTHHSTFICKNYPKQKKRFVWKTVEVNWAWHTCRFLIVCLYMYWCWISSYE